MGVELTGGDRGIYSLGEPPDLRPAGQPPLSFPQTNMYRSTKPMHLSFSGTSHLYNTMSIFSSVAPDSQHLFE